jgi:hypothetical protein
LEEAMSEILQQKVDRPTIQHNRCVVKGCAGESRWKPILMLKPMGWKFMRGKVAELPIPHAGFLCQEHRDLPIDTLLNLEERNQIAKHLQEQKVPTPDWSTARIGLAEIKPK